MARKEVTDLERVRDLRDIWEIQVEQQQNWHDWNNMSAATRMSLTRDLILGVQEEVGELQRRLLDRYHVPREANRRMSPMTIAEEGADLFKYIVALMALHNVDATMFGEAFVRKTRVINQRWAWQVADVTEQTRVLLCDLDGVFADWERGFRKFAESKGRPIPPGGLNDPKLEDLKDEFDGGGGFTSLDPMPGAVAGLMRVRETGIQVVVVTSRPYERHRRIYADTIEWCRHHGVIIDHVFFERDKARAIHTLAPARIIAMVEDRMKHALEVALVGVPVFKLPSEGDDVVAHPLITIVGSWADIIRHLEKSGDIPAGVEGEKADGQN